MSSGATTPAITDRRSTRRWPDHQDNITRLRIAWRRPQLDPALLEQNPKLRPANNFRSTPIMVGGVLYASNGIGLVEAFDPATGRTIWVQQVPESELPVGAASAASPTGARAERPDPDVPRHVYLRAGRPHRQARRGVRRRWARGSHCCDRRVTSLLVEWDTARRPRCRRAGVVDGRSGLGREDGRHARRRARFRRA